MDRIYQPEGREIMEYEQEERQVWFFLIEMKWT